jgi:hypothetical protein
MKQNFMSDKKRNTFSTLFTRAPPPPTRHKTAVFSTRKKNQVEKSISFFIRHEVWFYETTFSESALEH